MKRILYIGNKLATKNRTVSSIDVLGVLLEQENYRLYYASSKKNKLFRLIDMLFSCFKYRNKADLVLIDTYSTQNFYYALSVSQLCRAFALPYIPILHGGNLENRLKNNLNSCKKIFNHAQINVSPSVFLKTIFEDNGFHNIKYIPNVIEINRYSYQKRSNLQPKLLWVRSFAKIYNPKMAVAVLKILKEQGIEGSLCMIGPDKDGSMMEAKLLADELGMKIKFPGKLEKASWIDISKEYDIFINTTNFDNMPVSVIEAMALGLPVVSTNVGGIPYLLDDTKDSLLVEKGNAVQMATSIKTLLESPSLVMELTENARKKAESFDWNVIKNHWKELLQ